jgi:hypothetical protein
VTYEKNNEISVYVFGLENKEIVGSFYLTKQEEKNILCNLLLLEQKNRKHITGS